MSLEKLSNEEKQIVFCSLNAILNGGFLDGEFHMRIGVERGELESILMAFPDLDDSFQTSNAALAINNCLNEVCYGIEFSREQWSKWFASSPFLVEEVYRKWRDSSEGD